MLKALRKKLGVDKDFLCRAHHDKKTDCLYFLTEDCSYRAKRINDDLWILLHPHEETVIGVKIENWSDKLNDCQD